MRVSFRLGYKFDPELGVIPEAVIPVSILTKNGFYKTYDFIVDTGADSCIMPKIIAEDLGIDTKSLHKICFKGIEGSGIAAYLARITIKITKTPIDIACALSTDDKSPFVLGRKDIFSHFDIIFDNRKKLVTFSDIR